VFRVGEDALRNASVVVVLVEEELLPFLRLERDRDQVEVIEDLLLLGSPVIIVEVVIDPHEALVDHFRYDRLADGCPGYWELYLLASAHP
jgi:hypothetical protein